VRRARWLGCVVAALTSASASQALATPSAKLVYVRGTGTNSCPDESELRRAVSARIGYDPFFPTASKTVVAQVTRATKGFRARVQIVGDDGRVRGEKDLTTGGDDCNELIATMALAISIALDDLDDGTKAAPDAAATTPAATTPAAGPPADEEAPRAAVPETRPKDAPAPAPPTTNAPPSENRRLTMTASAGPALSIGAAPAPSVGGALAATIRYSWAAARFALRGDLPSSGDLERGGRVTTRTVLATAAACVRGDAPFFCAGAGLGSLDATTQEIARPSSDDALLVLLVATGGVDLALGSQLYVEPFVDAGLVLTRHRVSVDGISAYVLPVFAGTAGLHLGLRLF
jgi:hypothetical protein